MFSLVLIWMETPELLEAQWMSEHTNIRTRVPFLAMLGLKRLAYRPTAQLIFPIQTETA